MSPAFFFVLPEVKLEKDLEENYLMIKELESKTGEANLKKLRGLWVAWKLAGWSNNCLIMWTHG